MTAADPHAKAAMNRDGYGSRPSPPDAGARRLWTWVIAATFAVTFCTVLLTSGRDVPRIAALEARVRDPAHLFASFGASSPTAAPSGPIGPASRADEGTGIDGSSVDPGGMAGSPRRVVDTWQARAGSMHRGGAADEAAAQGAASRPSAGALGAIPPGGNPDRGNAAAEAQVAKIGSGLTALSGHGIAVDEVLPGSVAAQLGLRPGDVLLTIDGVPVDSLQQFAQIYQRDGVPRQLEGIRAGRPLHIHP